MRRSGSSVANRRGRAKIPEEFIKIISLSSSRSSSDRLLSEAGVGVDWFVDWLLRVSWLSGSTGGLRDACKEIIQV